MLQPSEYTCLDNSIRDMLALKCFTIACIFTSFSSHYYSNTEVDLPHSRPATRLSLVHTIPTITYSTIILVHHLRCILTGIVKATIPAVRSAHTEHRTGTCTGPHEVPFSFSLCILVPLLLLICHTCISLSCESYYFGGRSLL